MAGHNFDSNVVDAVLRHMNSDHSDDNLLIARAFVDEEASAASMVGLDGDCGTWLVRIGGAEREARVPWSTPVTERPEIRREVVVLYEAACAKLGVPARDH